MEVELREERAIEFSCTAAIGSRIVHLFPGVNTTDVTAR